jgi:hypothetical protein
MDADKLINLTKELREKYTHLIMNDSYNIYKSVQELKDDVKSNPKYKPITEKYESMLAIIFSDKYDEKRLEFMIRLATRVQKGELEEKTASVIVGQELVDNIVKPQLNKK